MALNGQPAAPLLASVLYKADSNGQKSQSRWLRTGIKALDDNLPPSLWQGGRVMGLVGSPQRPPIWPKLSDHIIATHLTSSPNLPADPIVAGSMLPTVFVIAGSSTNVASSIYVKLQALLPNLQHEDLLELLKAVSILQYFDPSGLAQSVAEVSVRLFELQNPSINVRGQLVRNGKPRMILLIDGMSATLSALQRGGSLVKLNALTASLLRSITKLSRGFPSLLVLLNLESRQENRTEGLRSAFSSDRKFIGGLSPGGVLGGTVLSALDAVILFHDNVEAGLTKDDLIVEVVLDRVDCHHGSWAVWPNGDR